MEFVRRLRRGCHLNLIALVCVFVSVSCLLVLLPSILRLPEVSSEKSIVKFPRSMRFERLNEEGRLGQLGRRMVGMLPDDLAFTVFVASEEAFQRDLRLYANDSFLDERASDAYAILSRVFGFLTIPHHLLSVAIPTGGKFFLESVSGFSLHSAKVSDGALIVNTVRAEQVDLWKGEIVMHIMSGVIMDAAFAQSFLLDDDAED